MLKTAGPPVTYITGVWLSGRRCGRLRKTELLLRSHQFYYLLVDGPRRDLYGHMRLSEVLKIGLSSNSEMPFRTSGKVEEDIQNFTRKGRKETPFM